MLTKTSTPGSLGGGTYEGLGPQRSRQQKMVEMIEYLATLSTRRPPSAPCGHAEAAVTSGITQITMQMYPVMSDTLLSSRQWLLLAALIPQAALVLTCPNFKNACSMTRIDRLAIISKMFMTTR